MLDKRILDKYHISISTGNKKMGSIPSVSLPNHSCNPMLKCYNDGCYSKRMEVFRPNIYKAWFNNFSLYINNPTIYKDLIKEKIIKEKYTLFRWHVGGDMMTMNYVRMVVDIAKELSETKFLAFTKCYEFINALSDKPDNLNIIISLWPDESPFMDKFIQDRWDLIRDIDNFKIAWLEDDTRIKRESYKPHMCTGSCESCQVCWTGTRDVIFHRH